VGAGKIMARQLIQHLLAKGGSPDFDCKPVCRRAKELANQVQRVQLQCTFEMMSVVATADLRFPVLPL